MQIEPARRRSNGTIDIDSYRQEARMLREQTRTEFFKTAGRAIQPLIGVMAIIAVYFSALHLFLAGPAAAEVPEAKSWLPRFTQSAHKSMSANRIPPAIWSGNSANRLQRCSSAGRRWAVTLRARAGKCPMPVR